MSTDSGNLLGGGAGGQCNLMGTAIWTLKAQPCVGASVKCTCSEANYNQTTQTDESGNYSFRVPTDTSTLNFNVSISWAGHTFEPPEQAVSVEPANANGVVQVPQFSLHS